MADIKKFNDFELNEDKDDKNIDRDIFSHKVELVNDDEQVKDEYIVDDGWSEDKLEEVGIIQWLEKVQGVAYELNNCRRGSYAISGDTGEDLKRQMEDLREELDGIIEDM